MRASPPGSVPWGLPGRVASRAPSPSLTTLAKSDRVIPSNASSIRDVWTAENAPQPSDLSALQSGPFSLPAVANCTGPVPGTSSYQSCTPPAGSTNFTAGEWTAVVNVLLAEVASAQQVLSYFAQLNQMRTSLFIAEGAELPAIGADLGLDLASQNQASFNFQGFFGGLTGIAASGAGAIPGIGPELSAALWVGSELISMLPSASPAATSDTAFETTYAGLQAKFATIVGDADKAVLTQSQEILRTAGCSRSSRNCAPAARGRWTPSGSAAPPTRRSRPGSTRRSCPPCSTATRSPLQQRLSRRQRQRTVLGHRGRTGRDRRRAKLHHIGPREDLGNASPASRTPSGPTARTPRLRATSCSTSGARCPPVATTCPVRRTPPGRSAARPASTSNRASARTRGGSTATPATTTCRGTAARRQPPERRSVALGSPRIGRRPSARAHADVRAATTISPRVRLAGATVRLDRLLSEPAGRHELARPRAGRAARPLKLRHREGGTLRGPGAEPTRRPHRAAAGPRATAREWTSPCTPSAERSLRTPAGMPRPACGGLAGPASPRGAADASCGSATARPAARRAPPSPLALRARRPRQRLPARARAGAPLPSPPRARGRPTQPTAGATRWHRALTLSPSCPTVAPTAAAITRRSTPVVLDDRRGRACCASTSCAAAATAACASPDRFLPRSTADRGSASKSSRPRPGPRPYQHKRARRSRTRLHPVSVSAEPAILEQQSYAFLQVGSVQPLVLARPPAQTSRDSPTDSRQKTSSRLGASRRDFCLVADGGVSGRLPLMGPASGKRKPSTGVRGGRDAS